MDTMNITINDLKRQLQIELDYTSDDALLQNYLNVAVISVKEYLGPLSLTGFTGYEVSGYTSNTPVPLTIPQAIILLACHWYLNRNIVSFGVGTEIPFTFRFLLDPWRDLIIA
jgi:Phage gp6-like head-tail connector protein